MNQSTLKAQVESQSSFRKIMRFISTILLIVVFSSCATTPPETPPTIEDPISSEVQPTAIPTTVPPTEVPVIDEELQAKLVEAIKAEDIAEVQRLLDAGANPNYETNHVIPMIVAASKGNMEIVKLLVEHGGDLTVETSTGKTPLDFEISNWPIQGEFVTGEITSPALANNLFDDPGTRSYRVYLPPSYSNGRDHYPVLYALHGGAAHDEYELQSLGALLDWLIDFMGAPEMIIVFPNSQTVFGGSYGSSIAMGDNETYITQDLVSFIDANFRTIANRESRGITGCAPGAAAAINYAFTHPDVFSVAAGITGLYDAQTDVLWISAQNQFSRMPDDLSGIKLMPFQTQVVMGFAAGAAPNPDNPPFFFDMPFEMVDGVPQIVPEVAEKIYAAYTTSVVAAGMDTYLAREQKLNGILLYHADNRTSPLPIEHTYALSEILTGAGIEHELYPDPTSLSCNNGEVILQFFIDNLAFEAAD